MFEDDITVETWSDPRSLQSLSIKIAFKNSGVGAPFIQ